MPQYVYPRGKAREEEEVVELVPPMPLAPARLEDEYACAMVRKACD